ncbi:ABC transporter ATP-binding protein [Citricoccus muralis]|uniref:ABC transporter ATP-binding protein n=1 Tax=Citricoccus muralis TaxID=169134 RepID=A0ABY8H7V3_9MICC|nr:ABC transporter ATP-binding protein [Citricoccus muralis]WFP17220.1 ABC transporter ATP-binding protein [Citricoccus muralis]
MTTVASVSNLSIRFGALTAVKNVSFTLEAGSCLALVGESGSGKSVTARALLGLSGGRVNAKELTVVGQDARNLTDPQWRRLRGARVSMILQDALMALDPLRPIHREIEDLLREHTKLNRAQRHERVIQALTDAGMDEPAYRAQQRSPQLSGGMRQRALIAQALLGDPDMVIADEATTALDTRLTALVLDQLNGIKHQGRAVLMISHDLAQVAQVADDIAVMRQGEIVEAGPAAQVLEDPQHAYTQMLLRAIPTGVPRHQPLSITTTPRTPPTGPSGLTLN